MKVQKLIVNGSIYDCVVFDTSVHTSSRIAGKYGIAMLNGTLYAISNKSGNWQFINQTTHGRMVMSNGTLGIGRSITYSLSYDQLSAIWTKAAANTPSTHKTGNQSIAIQNTKSTNERVLKADAIVYNESAEKTQFVRKGTTFKALQTLIESRGFPKDSNTKLMYLSNKSVHPVYKTEVVTTTTFAL